MVDTMARVAKMLGNSGVTLQHVHDTLVAEGMSEYDIFLTCKGAAMLWPHVAEAIADACPDTLPQGS